jgi:hypothetical protein
LTTWSKGIIERAHDYLERSFLPGRTFASPTDFNTQPADREHSYQAGAGMRTGGSYRGGSGRDAGAAAGGPGHGVVFLVAVAA